MDVHNAEPVSGAKEPRRDREVSETKGGILSLIARAHFNYQTVV